MEHAFTIQVTNQESTIESKSKAHPSNCNWNYFRQSAFTRVLARWGSRGYVFRYPLEPHDRGDRGVLGGTEKHTQLIDATNIKDRVRFSVPPGTP